MTFCIAVSIACGQTNDDNTLTALPFDLIEWLGWQSDIDLGEMENDGRYKSILLSKNKDLQLLINTIYPQYFNTHYFTLKSNKVNCEMHIIVSTVSGEVGLYYNFITLKGNKRIASLPLIALLEENDRKTFVISENLEITFFNEKTAYNEKEDRYEVTERKKIGIYQIQKDGEIIKVK